SAVMPIGKSWADQYGKKQTFFGLYSVIFGMLTEIMFWLSFLDMFAIMANSILFGYLLLEYVNWTHAVHNIGVAVSFCVLYVRYISSGGSNIRIINNVPVLEIEKYIFIFYVPDFRSSHAY
ncbi:hypothetical protein PENTCL1PPCAC_14399, partial [Pristionchus entomophagus]